MRIGFVVIVLALGTMTAVADRVQRTALLPLSPAFGAGGRLVADLAAAPDGLSIAAWIEGLGSAGSAIQFAILTREGGILVGPTSLPISGRIPAHVSVGATPQGFLIAYAARANAAAQHHDIFVAFVSRTGVVRPTTGTGQLHSTSNLDDLEPSVCGNIDGNFAVAWRQSAVNFVHPNTGQQVSANVLVRRLAANGTRIDSGDVSVRLGIHRSAVGGIAVGYWRDRLVVAWHDGYSIEDAYQGGTQGGFYSPYSPDGYGQGILAVWFDARPTGGLVPLGPERLITSEVFWDQFNPVIAVDQRNTCIIGWSGNPCEDHYDAFCRRFDDAGVALEPADTLLTPGDTVNDQFLTDVGMSAHGEAICTWMSSPATAGQPAPRAGFTRFAQDFSVIETGLLDAGGAPTEAQVFPRLGVDEYGHFLSLVQVSTASTAGLRLARYARTVLQCQPVVGVLGASHTLTIDSPSDARRAFVILAALGAGPQSVDSRLLRLDRDAIFELSLTGAGAGLFSHFSGVLDGAGRSPSSAPPRWVLPFLPALSGAQLHFAVLTDGPGAPSGLNTISDALVLPVL